MSAAITLDAVLSQEIAQLRRVALTIARDPSEADDLVQETALAACRFWAKFDAHRGQPGNWLRTIMRNLARNRARSSSVRAKHDPEWQIGLHEAAVLGGKSADEQIDESRRIAKIRDAVDALPDQYKTTLLMADFEGRSYKEIARLTNVPMGTVMSRIHRGRKMVEAAL